MEKLEEILDFNIYFFDTEKNKVEKSGVISVGWHGKCVRCSRGVTEPDRAQP